MSLVGKELRSSISLKHTLMYILLSERIPLWVRALVAGNGSSLKVSYCELLFPLNSSCMTSVVIGVVLTVERR